MSKKLRCLKMIPLPRQSCFIPEPNYGNLYREILWFDKAYMINLFRNNLCFSSKQSAIRAAKFILHIIKSHKAQLNYIDSEVGNWEKVWFCHLDSPNNTRYTSFVFDALYHQNALVNGFVYESMEEANNAAHFILKALAKKVGSTYLLKCS